VNDEIRRVWDIAWNTPIIVGPTLGRPLTEGSTGWEESSMLVPFGPRRGPVTTEIKCPS